jgi:predicted ATPase
VLIRILHEAVSRGGQVICATHPPVITALPGAAIIELGPHGMRHVTWEELDMVDHWRRYLQRPSAYLRHVLEDG